MRYDQRLNFENISEEINHLRNSLLAYKANIISAYLFGSVARGETRPLSDIDFAYLLAYDNDKIEASIYKLVTSAFGTDKVDFVNLKDAPLSLQYQIIKEGTKIITGNETARVNFETSVIMNYLDFQPLRKEFYEEFLKAL
ncbi:MAG: nucleotidyltransferase domain-containing protein [Clostridia bacterium]|nr:nucleotidyltransferase domain-containing protein [Clostridia bacterium]